VTDTPALVNISDPSIYDAGPPHETFAWLRDNEPVSRQTSPGGRPYWAVVRYEDIRTVNRSAQLFRSGSGTTFVDLVEGDTGNNAGVMMLGMDNPQHAAMRNIVQRAFTPKAINALEGDLRRRATRIVDDVCERGSCDLAADIATLLPLQGIASLLGIPDADFPRVVSWATAMAPPGSMDSVTSAGRTSYGNDPLAGMVDMATYAGDLATQRREDPQDDLVSKLVVSSPEGNPLTPEEFQGFWVLLFVAGFDTTRHSIGHGFSALMENRAQWEELVATGTIEDAAVEEILRWATPIQHMARTANEDTELAGQRIARDEHLVMWYISGNRDERAFPDPFRFDIHRNPMDVLAPTGHVAFGGGGPHYCLGNALARMEIKIMFEELLRRLPDIRQTGPTKIAPTNLFHFVTHLPVEFTPTRRSDADL
jgi:cholest-4-en-3-one 26-monooxygenase